MADTLSARGRPQGAATTTRGAAGTRDLGRENAVLRELVTVYRHLSGLATQDTDLAGVVRLIAQRTGATVAVVSQLMDVIAAAKPDTPPDKAAALVRDQIVHPRLGQVLRASRQSHRALRLPSVGGMPASIVVPILVGDEVPAHLITFDPADETGFEEDMSLLITEHAATICGVILGREHVVAAAARRVRDDLVEGLLLGRGRDSEETNRWAAHLGYSPAHDHNVVAISFEVTAPSGPDRDVETLRNQVRESIEHFVTTRAPEAIVSARTSEVVVVTAEPAVRSPTHLGPRQLGELCIARLTELFPSTTVVVGIGGTFRDPTEIARSYAQAHRTTEAMRRLGRTSTVTAFEDLGIHRLLLQVPDLAELRSFATDVLGRLSVHEREHRSEYLATLACYFREAGSPQRAARILHVHPNTVAYRIRRIQEITGLKLDDYRDRLLAQVALEILEALGDEP